MLCGQGKTDVSIFAEFNLPFNYVITRGKRTRLAFYHAFDVWSSIVDLASCIYWRSRD